MLNKLRENIKNKIQYLKDVKWKYIFKDQWYLVVVLDHFPSPRMMYFAMNNNIEGADTIRPSDRYISTPVIKHIPLKRDLRLYPGVCERMIKDYYEGQEIMLIPVKWRWVFNFVRHGNDLNQNYNVVTPNGIKHVKNGPGIK